MYEKHDSKGFNNTLKSEISIFCCILRVLGSNKKSWENTRSQISKVVKTFNYVVKSCDSKPLILKGFFGRILGIDFVIESW